MVDVFLSVYPFSKPLALLLATLLLLCLGGLALFWVTDGTLADSMWLSWTYVADSGNHANSVGIGPKLVSVSITFGGMFIFAMMLGLVSDAISDKFDSLRKGRSEVIEKNHTLILGWSDKLEERNKSRKRERSNDEDKREGSEDRRSKERGRADQNDRRERGHEYDRHSKEHDRHHDRDRGSNRVHDRDLARPHYYDSRSRRSSCSPERSKGAMIDAKAFQ